MAIRVLRGKIVLVPFPFTDLSDVKVRPALAVSRSGRSDGDVMITFIGTYRGQALEQSDLLIENTHPDFAGTGLKSSSFIRLGKLMTLESGIL